MSLRASNPKEPTGMMALATAMAKAKAKVSAKAPPQSGSRVSASSSGYQGPMPIAPLPKAKSKSMPKKTPPYPPIERCIECTDFTFKGSTAYTIKRTCFDCGHSTTTRREKFMPTPLRTALTKLLIIVVLQRLLAVFSVSNVGISFTGNPWNKDAIESLLPRM